MVYFKIIIKNIHYIFILKVINVISTIKLSKSYFDFNENYSNVSKLHIDCWFEITFFSSKYS